MKQRSFAPFFAVSWFLAFLLVAAIGYAWSAPRRMIKAAIAANRRET